MYVCGGRVETHLMVLYSALPHNFNSFSVLIVMLINDCDYNIQQQQKEVNLCETLFFLIQTHIYIWWIPDSMNKYMENEKDWK